MTRTSERPVARIAGRHPPTEIRDDVVWVLWDLEHKTALAPWHTGHCYRADWHGKLAPDERPETTYETARMYAEIPTQELHRTHPFPTTDENDEPIDDPIPDQVAPTILLPPEGQGTERTARLMYIDFDDVRDPETDAIPEEVAKLIERLDSYTEVSSSGTGLHVLVYAELPECVGAIDGEPLDTEGSIEIYDHSRLLGATWRHVEGTPTQINDRQTVVDDLLDEYAANRLASAEAAQVWEETGLSDTNQGSEPRGPGCNGRNSGSGSGSGGSSGSGHNDYFAVDLTDFADAKALSGMSSIDERENERQGAHPDHGKTTHGEPGNLESYNYNIDTKRNRWHCFADNSGGGPMEMAAVMADTLDCDDACKGALDKLSDDAFLYTCLYARDRLHGFTEDMTPPYRALVTIAKRHDLPMSDPDREILGGTIHACAKTIYDNTSHTDI